jgi:hypothetical protein
MLRRYRLVREEETDAHVYGATMARVDLRLIVEDLIRIAPSANGALDVVLDFTGIVSATSSYLKRSVLWLYDCARLAAEGGHAGALDDLPIPLDIYVFITGLADDVCAELKEVLLQQNRICLEVPPDVTDSIPQARLLGPLDQALRDTLDALARTHRATATELHQAYISDRQKITVNAWNNRLSDLFCKRLARRSKVGRHWVYEPVVPEVQTHG